MPGSAEPLGVREAGACPVRKDAASAPPDADLLSYSLTLPAGPASAGIARRAAQSALRVHGLHDMRDATVHVVGELVAYVWQFTPSTEVYVSLRYRDGALRVTAYDGHPRHTHPRVAAACEARRRAALRLMGCVVRACAGEWGFAEAREPGGGTRTWAVLPRGSAAAFGQSDRSSPAARAARAPVSDDPGT
ncbi:ATP-binding protein [Streptomyces sp. TS71-3]|uniref:ATP-binding protein n=1 Tax=Streptomyces sp. TS71-3 TaxID=2733862 RepID=UPI001B1CA16A|nr:ATP-binding protein [Streptomyces sp. TS71-3]GHJ35362.1 hypothetical protein Sm713_09710 [Streptomyces sp. TS71-3]